jgi:hypothetical protein
LETWVVSEQGAHHTSSLPLKNSAKAARVGRTPVRISFHIRALRLATARSYDPPNDLVMSRRGNFEDHARILSQNIALINR